MSPDTGILGGEVVGQFDWREWLIPGSLPFASTERNHGISGGIALGALTHPVTAGFSWCISINSASEQVCLSALPHSKGSRS